LPGASFALSGAVLAPPADEAVADFGVRVARTDIEVEVSARPSSKRGA
jgi:hypothetical protein